MLLVVLGTNDAYMGPRIIANEPPFLAQLTAKLWRVTRNVLWIGPPKLANRPKGADAFKSIMAGADGQWFKPRQHRS